ncbi:hypothetical protein [Tumebacillus lipolyticus]|uniref:Uncharacterized protein n=1 Tax=Tumebacillus lipolyticus TaxID=1280370 RepID=A0ABW4ZZZ4_9BACL
MKKLMITTLLFASLLSVGLVINAEKTAFINDGKPLSQKEVCFVNDGKPIVSFVNDGKPLFARG